MARGTRNSLNTYYLAAPISIGASSCTLTVDPDVEMPTAETFSVNIGDLEGTPASQEVIDCTRSGTTLTFVDVTTKEHAAGDAVNLVFSQNDYENFAQNDEVSGAITTHDGATTAHAGATNLVQAGGDEMTGTLEIDVASAIAQLSMDYGSSGTKADFVYDGYGVEIRLGGSTVFYLDPTTLAIYVGFILADVAMGARGYKHEAELVGSSYNVDLTNPPGILIVDQNDSDIYLPNVSSHAVYNHMRLTIVVQCDAASFSECRIHPYTANASGSPLITQHSRINTKGKTSGTGIYDTLVNGPDGTYYSITDANSRYLFETSRQKDSTAGGHIGTWVAGKIGDIG